MAGILLHPHRSASWAQSRAEQDRRSLEEDTKGTRQLTTPTTRPVGTWPELPLLRRATERMPRGLGSAAREPPASL